MKQISTRFWRITFWILLSGWVLGAILTMMRVQGGFFTSYLSDLTFPPFAYIFVRGLANENKQRPTLLLLGSWLGQSAMRSAIWISIAGLVYELLQLFWPQGPISGTFDVVDIILYVAGLTLCYLFDNEKP